MEDTWRVMKHYHIYLSFAVYLSLKIQEKENSTIFSFRTKMKEIIM